MTPAIRLLIGATVALAGMSLLACTNRPEAENASRSVAASPSCDTTATGLSLPAGFCATLFADNLGHARHMAFGDDGTLYVNTWSGAYYRNSPPPPGGMIVALRDADGDGKAESVRRFGKPFGEGSAGGVGIAYFRRALFAEEGDRILRFAIGADGAISDALPATIVSGMPLTGDHPMHPFMIDATGAMFVNSGSATNACELRNRMPGSVGHQPCTELETRGGIWRFDANRLDQPFTPAARYATGIRNAGGLAFDAAGRLFATQHGRDQLGQNWPHFFTSQAGEELPAEQLMLIEKGGDYGWPACYFDGSQKRLMLAPEYGGDGERQGLCTRKQAPVAAFPAHWAPNDLLFYDGENFPEAYRGGAFIAFHGSWNRAPAPQAGYNVVFQPFANGKPSGAYILFADGFAGAVRDPGKAAHRPAGLAMDKSGALYVADDVTGRIWRITYHGNRKAGLVAARPATPTSGNHEEGGAATAIPPGFTARQVALGQRIFTGAEKGGTCAGCHGSDGKGTSVGPDLTDGVTLWTDGSVASIARLVTLGVDRPKQSSGAMPPMGGAALSPADVQAVAAYIWSLNHGSGPAS
jgi:glucose/arabinose dehydrogenase/mono/diheme cytochrome c family protein